MDLVSYIFDNIISYTGFLSLKSLPNYILLMIYLYVFTKECWPVVINVEIEIVKIKK